MELTHSSPGADFDEDPGKYEMANYAFVPASAAHMVDYRRLIQTTYEPLGFLNDHADCFLPRDGTTCYVLTYRDQIVGSCALTRVRDADSIYYDYLPVDRRDRAIGMIELNNIILVPGLRGGIGLSLILYNSALTTLAEGSGLVVGITRYQTLRYFVEAGAIPVSHEPLHLLGREDLNDFIIYYDVRSQDSQTYLRERAQRLFGQASVLGDIKRRIQLCSSRRKTTVPAETIAGPSNVSARPKRAAAQ